MVRLNTRRESNHGSRSSVSPSLSPESQNSQDTSTSKSPKRSPVMQRKLGSHTKINEQ